MQVLGAVNTLPPEHDWRTSDEDELLKRRLRAGDEKFRTLNDPVWSAELIPLKRGVVPAAGFVRQPRSFGG